jgi:putative PIN family toxin of toxin-antitoxin system
MRVVIDANVFIGYLLTPNEAGVLHTIVDALFEGQYTLLFFEDLIEELAQTTIRKQKLAKRILVDEMDELLSSLKAVAEEVSPITEAIPAIVRDYKDDYLVAYSVVYHADYLVTGDKDLLTLQQIEQVKIITPGEFAHLMKDITSS